MYPKYLAGPLAPSTDPHDVPAMPVTAVSTRHRSMRGSHFTFSSLRKGIRKQKDDEDKPTGAPKNLSWETMISSAVGHDGPPAAGTCEADRTLNPVLMHTREGI